MTTSFWIEKAWGGQVDSATINDIMVAINETINMDDEHGAFWVGHSENERVLEVHKGLDIFYMPSNNLDDQLKTKLNSWQEVEYLYRQFLDEKYEQITTFIKARNDRVKIIETLKKLLYFFEEHKVSDWTERTKNAIQQIQEGKDKKTILHNFVGVGMGSLIDLYICVHNGYFLQESEAEANMQLQKLTEQILTIQNALQ